MRPLLLLSALLLMPLTTLADDSEKGWEIAATKPTRVRVRPVKGTSVQEMWATATVKAKPYTVQTVLADPLSFPKFMPYITQTRFLGEPDETGARYLYTRLEIPGLSARDFISYAKADQLIAPDGTGEFLTSWTARPDYLPVMKGVVRLKINEGTWHVRAAPDGNALVDYRFLVDPGGFVPAFLVNMANRTVISDIFKALEKEAIRRDALISTAGAAMAAVVPVGVTDAGTAGADGGVSTAADGGVSTGADGGVSTLADGGAAATRGDGGAVADGGEAAKGGDGDGGSVIALDAGADAGQGATADGGFAADAGTTRDAGTPPAKRRSKR